MKPPINLRNALGLLAGGVFLGAIVAFLVHLRLGSKGKPVEPLKARRAAVVILCIGDSLTAEGYPEQLREKLKTAGFDTQVLNYGVPGFMSGEYLDYMKSEQLLEKIRPDVVLLQLGTNDARCDFNYTNTKDFVRNMQEIVRIATTPGSSGRRPVLLIALVPPVVEQFPSFSATSVQRIAKEINPAIERIAEEQRLIVVDNYALFADRPKLIEGIHPTEEGYQAMADNWLNALVRNQIVKEPVEKK